MGSLDWHMPPAMVRTVLDWEDVAVYGGGGCFDQIGRLELSDFQHSEVPVAKISRELDCDIRIRRPETSDFGYGVLAKRLERDGWQRGLWRPSPEHPELRYWEFRGKFEFELFTHPKLLKGAQWATWDSLGQLLVARKGWIERYTLHDLAAPQPLPSFSLDLNPLERPGKIPNPPLIEGAAKEAHRMLWGFDRPWHFAGGWAIDLFLGRIRRDHKDADIAIDYEDQMAFRDRLFGRQMDKVVNHESVPWNGERLDPPAFQFFCGVHMEFLLEKREPGMWLYRRDPWIRMPAERAYLQTPEGIPYLNPAIVLLFKSQKPSPWDEDDFRDASPHLPESDRKWLADAIARADPSHPWLASLH